jgi:sulfite exporter TauE/SafE
MNAGFLLLLPTAFLLGVGSSAHCFGMCGGIACALGLQGKSKSALMLYHAARILAYSVIALLLGGLLQQAQEHIPQLGLWLRTAAGLLLLAMALHTLKIWGGILVLEKLGAHAWNPLQKIGKFLLPAQNNWQILALGFLWGWLPCALVYSTLAWAVTQANALQSAALMFTFGLGTIPALLLSGLLAQQSKALLQKPVWSYGMALLLAICAWWTISSAWQHQHHHKHEHANTDVHHAH